MDAELTLIRSGAISAEDYIDALSKREAETPRLGQVAIEEGMLTARQVLTILTRQYASPERLFGKIAIEEGYLKPEQVETLLEQQRKRQRSVIDHLVELGHLSVEQAEFASTDAMSGQPDMALA